MNKFVTAGIDIGSVTTKVVILDEEKMPTSAICPTGAYPKQSAEKVLAEALRQTGLLMTDIGCIISTGYGRRAIEFGNRVITEISAAARGASHLDLPCGKVRTVIDLGGQDSKAISLDEEGKVVDFVMNDRCAAGTGRFLEVISGVLEVGLEDIGRLSLKSGSPMNISSICTVFAESEVISLIAQGKRKEDIIAGIHSSIAERICGMVSKVGAREVISFIGGGAKNIGVKKAIEDRLQMRMWIPENPQFVIAMGAALIARELL
ncbi:MAG: (R)-phenyllactate dehydratase activator [candidate division WS2 bacterium]|nr:(R)-phenyllactate dehydratase activator [Candidatus Psychracetigena formicireducens]